MGVLTGLEVLLRDGHPLVSGRRIGLLTHRAAVDAAGRPASDRLAADRRWRLVALFGPEHGVRGDAPAGVHVASGTDPATGLPVHSLYGPAQTPGDELLAGLDALVVDLQDIGVRYFTYAATAAACLAPAAARGLPVLVLDRPAPLGGRTVEGGRLREELRSLVGVAAVPIRHGLTLGELLGLVAAERGLPSPEVVAVEGWSRGAWQDETGLPWVPPSPNLRSLETALLYCGTCLVEGTSLSEGRGTERPFLQVGAPWLDGPALAARLRGRALPGVDIAAVTFRPASGKHAGARCAGVAFRVTDRDALRPTELGLALLADAIALSGDAFTWRTEAFDRLAGDPLVRETLARGGPLDPLLARWRTDAQAFAMARARYLRYGDERLS